MYSNVKLLIFIIFQPEEVVKPYLKIIEDFREKVRDLATHLKATDILKECDRLQDGALSKIVIPTEEESVDVSVKIKTAALSGEDPLVYEKSLNEFFCNVKDTIQKVSMIGTEISIFEKWGKMEFQLNKKFDTAKDMLYGK